MKQSVPLPDPEKLRHVDLNEWRSEYPDVTHLICAMREQESFRLRWSKKHGQYVMVSTDSQVWHDATTGKLWLSVQDRVCTANIFQHEPETVLVSASEKQPWLDGIVKARIVAQPDHSWISCNHIIAHHEPGDARLNTPDRRFTIKRGYTLSWETTKTYPLTRGFCRALNLDPGQSHICDKLEAVVCTNKPGIRLEMLTGEEIDTVYRDGDGSKAPTSCMVGERKDHARKIYAANPGKIHLAVLRNTQTGVVLARALVWTDVDGKQWRDLEYSIDGSVSRLRLLRMLGEQHPEIQHLAGHKSHVVCRFVLPENRAVPYLDTFDVAATDHSDPARIVYLATTHTALRKWTDKNHIETTNWDYLSDCQSAGGGDWYQHRLETRRPRDEGYGRLNVFDFLGEIEEPAPALASPV